jgi:hypothetical protein
VNSVKAALNWYDRELKDDRPDAAGIDTLMYWEIGPAGWRAADIWLRERYPAVRDGVMAMAMCLRKSWPEIALNETHPKVLYYALAQHHYAWGEGMVTWLRNAVHCVSGPDIANDHEWDALISAWATRCGISREWSHDLKAHSREPLEPAGPVTYWWPETT